MAAAIRPSDGQKKKKNKQKSLNFVVQVDHKIKTKESVKRDYNLDLARELKKKTWNMKIMIIPIVIRALETIPKGLVKGLEDLANKGQAETILTTALLGRTKY